MRSLFFKAALLVAAASAMTFAVRPTDVNTGTDLQPDRHARVKGSAADAFKRGLHGMRPVVLQDVRDSKLDGAYGGAAIRLSGTASTAVQQRLTTRLKGIGGEARIVAVQTDRLGIRHIRLQQFLNGMPVVGGEVIAHVDKQNQLIAVTGQWAPLMRLATATTTIPVEKAKAAVLATAPDQKLTIASAPKLVVFDGRLAYEITARGTAEAPVRMKCYVDASSGSVLMCLDQIMPAGPGSAGAAASIDGVRLTGEDGATVTMTGWQDNGGGYFMYSKDSAWSVYNLRTSDWEQRTTSAWGESDPAAVSLGRNLATVQDWVMGTLGRTSFDNLGAMATANVHEGYDYVNAYWDGEDFHFGDGDGYSAGPLTVLDIVGHEYGHAVTQYTSNLVYAYEAGALNESYSDIIGTAIEFATQPDGRDAYPSSVDGKADWLCGEDCWLEADALRDLRDPQRFGQPSYYQGSSWFSGDGDNGGVHYNSGVQNFAFYLLAEGGSGINDGFPYAVNGIGIDNARSIALYADMYLLTADAQYRDSRNAWILAASLLGFDTLTVRDVWTAVGLPPLEKHLTVSSTSLDFGVVGFGVAETLWLELVNQGGDTSTVSALEFDNTHFTTATALPLKVKPSGTAKVSVIFNPDGYPVEKGALTIVNDAMDNPAIGVTLQGSGAEPAEISVDPASIAATLKAGDTAACELVVTNSGEADLKLNADIGLNVAQKHAPALLRALPRTGAAYRLAAKAAPAKALSPKTNLNPRIKPIGEAASVLYLTTFMIDPTAGDMFTSGMRGLPNVASVTVVDVSAQTPNLEYLQQYDVVVVSSDYPLGDPKLLGNTLADYVDNGGKVVLTVGSIANTGNYGLQGRITTPEYLPMAMSGPGQSSSATSFADHPITAGLSYLSTEIPIDAQQLQGNGVSLGSYNNGYLVGACNPDKPVVALNVFPADYYWQGDLIMMMGNTFNWMNRANWLKVQPLHQLIKVAANESCTLRVTLDSRKLFGGQYTAAIMLRHNARQAPNPLNVPCTLVVDGERLLTVTPASLDYGTVWTDRSKALKVTIENPGTEATMVQSVVSDNPAYTFSIATPFTLPPQSRTAIDVRFTPSSAQAYPGALTIVSDAELDPTQAVSLSGSGVTPPIIACTPKVLKASLNPSALRTFTVTLTNSGGAEFPFDAQAVNYASSAGQSLSSAQLYGMYGGFIYRIDPISGSFMGEGIRLDSMLIGSIGNRGLAYDGQYLYAAGYGNEIEVIDPASGMVVRRMPTPDYGSFGGLGASDQYVFAINSWDRMMYVFDKQTGVVAHSWGADGDCGTGLTYAGNRGTVFASGNGEIVEYNVEDGTVVNRFNPSVYGISGLAYSSSARVLFVSSAYTNSIIAVNPDNGATVATISGLMGLDGLAGDEAGQGWLTIAPQSGVVPAGGSLALNVTMSSDRIPAGLNTATVNVTHAGEGAPGPFAIPCSMTVASVRSLSVSPTSVKFDTTWLNMVDTAFVVLKNSGSAPTEVRMLQVKGTTSFTFGATLPLTVPPYGQARVKVFFRPTATGIRRGQLNITSDASDHPALTVGLSGVAVKSPRLTSTLTRLALSLLTGETARKSFSLVNSGGAAYPFVMRARCNAIAEEQPSLTATPSSASLFALDGGSIYQIDPVTGAKMDEPVVTSVPGYLSQAGLAYDGKLLYVSNPADSVGPGAILVYNPYNGKLVRTLQLPDIGSGMDGLGVSDQYLIASVQYPPACYVLDKTTGAVVTSWTIPTAYEYHYGSLSYAGGRGSVFIAEGSVGVIREHDLMSGAVLREFNAPNYAVNGLGFSTVTNTLFAGSYDGNVYSLNPDDGSVLDSIRADLPYGVADLASDEAGAPLKWLALNVAQGVLSANGGMANVTATVDTRKLDAGTYVGEVEINYTGKGSLPPVVVPCTLSVRKASRLVVSSSKVDFGSVGLKSTACAQLTFTNQGDLPTTIAKATSTNAVFGISLPTPLVVPARGSATVKVTFTPLKKGIQTATYVISSDAVDNPKIAVTAKGTGVAAR
jgi:Zn-dependent metalloprotease/WD40 repeat protein